MRVEESKAVLVGLLQQELRKSYGRTGNNKIMSLQWFWGLCKQDLFFSAPSNSFVFSFSFSSRVEKIENEKEGKNLTGFHFLYTWLVLRSFV